MQYYLPEESRNHVKKFIATHYIMETGDSGNNMTGSSFDYTTLNGPNNLPGISSEEDTASDTVTVSGRYIAAVIAKKFVLDIKI